MDRGAWHATAHGVSRVGHDGATKPPQAQKAKDLPANAGDPGSIPGKGRSSGEGNGMAIHSRILAWRMPWTVGLQRVRHNGATNTLSTNKVTAASLVAQW